jgi:hypothetical protein
LYCLKHAAELECFRQGGFSKPKCMRPGCNWEHAVGAHRLLGESDTYVNLTTGDDNESEEEEEWWVNTVRAEEKEEDLEEVGDSEPEENGEREVRYFPSTYMRKDDSGLEDELEYFWEAPIPSGFGEQEEDRWCSPGPQEPSSEEDKEEVLYLTNLLGLRPTENETEDGEPPPLTRGAPSTSGGSRLPSPERPAKKKKEDYQEPSRAQSRPLRRSSKEGDLGKR